MMCWWECVGWFSCVFESERWCYKFGVVDVRWVMSRCVERWLVCVWWQFVCVVGVLLFLIELGINKFCGLSDERFLKCEFGCDDMLVRVCWLIKLYVCEWVVDVLGVCVVNLVWQVWGGWCYGVLRDDWFVCVVAVCLCGVCCCFDRVRWSKFCGLGS